MTLSHRGHRIALAVVAAAAGVPGQDDLRDVVTLKDGTLLRGRVFARYEPGQVTVRVGQERRTLPASEVAALDTVRDRVREFFARLDRLPNNVKNRWFLAEWAASRGLPDLARVAALDLVLREPDHEGARALLGHRRHKGEWQWPFDGAWKSLAELEALRSRWQDAWCIEGEHFRVKSNADLRRVVDAVWDLERFHLAWFDRFGEGLRLYEVANDKMQMEIWRDERRFPGNKTVPGEANHKSPWFDPGGGDLFGHVPPQPGWRTDRKVAISYTYFPDETAARPLRLFEAATSHLIFCTVGGNSNVASGYRPAAWCEVGLGRYLDHSMTGPAGRATLGAWRIDPQDGRAVLAEREHRLRDVALYDSKKLWGGVSDENAFAWPAAELAVAWMLESGRTELRHALLGYLGFVYRPIRMDSSSELDRLLGQPIERLDAPWRAWIEQQLRPQPQQPTTPGRR